MYKSSRWSNMGLRESAPRKRCTGLYARCQENTTDVAKSATRRVRLLQNNLQFEVRGQCYSHAGSL